MAFTYPVKWITSTMRGAPVLSGTAGTFIGILDAFLLTGWGAANAISVTVADGVGTVIFDEGTYFEDHSVVLIAGATTPAELNGEARVLSHTNNSITFETDAPDGTATTGSTITFKYAPVGGWEKKYSGTNLAVYKSTDVMAAGHLWRVDDTGTTAARMVGYESMTDVHTGIGPFPTAAYISGGGYVYKSMAASAAAARYAMAADSRTTLLGIAPGVVTNANYMWSNIRGFGDAIALAPSGDPWCSFLSATGSNAHGSATGALSGGSSSLASAGFTSFVRSVSALGASVTADVLPASGSINTMSGSDSFMGPAPSVVDGQIKMARVFLKELGTNPPRCIVPGVLYVPQSGLASVVASHDIAEGDGPLAGRKLMAILGATSANTATPGGAAFIDITGPWR